MKRHARRRPHALLLLTLFSALSTVGCQLMPGRAPTVWVVDDSTDLRPDSPPQRENRIYSAARGRVRLISAINETVAFQVGVQAGLQTPPLRVDLSNFETPDGQPLADAAVQLYLGRVAEISNFASWYTEHTGRAAVPQQVFDPLVPLDAALGDIWRIPRDRTALLWVDLTVPPTAEPGTYTAALRFRDANTSDVLSTTDVSITVLPVALPSEPTLPVIARVAPMTLLTEQMNWPREPDAELRLLPDDPRFADARRLIGEAMQMLQAHGGNPVLWAAFPRFRLNAAGDVDLDWDDYIRVVRPWLDGTGYADRVGARYWALPVSVDWPSTARHGGIAAPRYARVLRGYLRAVGSAFQAEGFRAIPFLRPIPPQPLTATHVRQARVFDEILTATGIDLPFAVHLPPRSLRGLGWYEAPPITGVTADIWSPPADWFEPAALAEQQLRGDQAWFTPAFPPFSGSLALDSLSCDPRSLAWQAYRYGCEALWIEHAVDSNGPDAPLVYPGAAWDHAGPLPSVRLKRLRRGVQDHALLTVLARRGQRLLAERVAREMLHFAFTEAARDSLLNTLPAGWPRDAQTYDLARLVLLQELAAAPQDNPLETARRADVATRWRLFLESRADLFTAIRGVRVSSDLSAVRVLTETLNHGTRPVEGVWTLDELPTNWPPPTPLNVRLEPGDRRQAALELNVPGLAYGRGGVRTIRAWFEPREGPAIAHEARLAVTGALAVDRGPHIDGVLSDFPITPGNVADDFRLNRYVAPGAFDERKPARGTRVLFCFDAENLYVGIRAEVDPLLGPAYATDNRVPMDRDQPWDQAVVEVLLSPQNVPAGTPADLFLLQVKPNSLVRAYRGAPTEPLISPLRSWDADVRVATQQIGDTWTAEIAIPFAAFGDRATLARVWGANITRLDARRGEYSSWSATAGLLYTPEALGNLVFVGR